ncbi:MAG: pilus assembly protein [Castellaniella sp.]|uniref:TadE/TadG family type IV pilus assembly protein n=1 Tax=Castellaniella sp. TaxID=1955812 RepID=UPI001205A76C|nr:TadE/TadG family type IV pilus assembly protein [Castellaniella sp.]TAN27925.1 MAG: pilus assembly protein [Castellaniella sp.]
MSPIKPLRRFAHRLQHNQRGAVALTFLAVSAVMLMGTFGAIDLARYNIAETRLRDAVDATSISAAQALGAWDPAITSDKTAWQNYAGAFFSVNMPDDYLNSDVTANTIKSGIQYCTADSSGNITCPSQAPAGTPMSAQYVNVTAQGKLPLLSTGFMKVASFTLSANNQVIRRLKNNTEIVLALEDSQYTGTASNANIKTAAQQLVAAALGSMNLSQSSSAQGIRVGVVPFSAMVRMNPSNTGAGTPNAKNWVSTVAKLLGGGGGGVNAYVQSNWLGCIAEPYPPPPPPFGTGISWGYWGQNSNPQLPAAKLAPPDPTNTSDPHSFVPVFMPIPATSKGANTSLGNFVTANSFTVTQLLNGSLTSTTLQFQQSDISTQGQGNKNPPLVTPRAPYAGAIVPNDAANYRFIGIDTSTSLSSNWGNVAPVVYSAFEPDSCAMVGLTQFLSQSVATLDTAINSMQGWSNSESLIPGGLLWAWRMLAPEWSDNKAGTGRGWDDTQPGLPADPANTDITKPMVNGRAIILVSTGTNSTVANPGPGSTMYRAPLMYNPPLNPPSPPNPSGPTQQSDFQMVVNYCDNRTSPTTDTSTGKTTCTSGNPQIGVITSPASTTSSTPASIITGDSPVGNRGNGQDSVKTIAVWPTTSLVNLDMRSPTTIISTFAASGNKLVGQNTYSSFQDGNATIGWPAGATDFTTTDVNAYMQAVCTAIKNDSSSYPIRLYTVFVGGSGGAGQTNMGNCASGPAYAFTNYNTNNLSSTFAAILGSMTELRLTK